MQKRLPFPNKSLLESCSWVDAPISKDTIKIPFLSSKGKHFVGGGVTRE